MSTSVSAWYRTPLGTCESSFFTECELPKLHNTGDTEIVQVRPQSYGSHQLTPNKADSRDAFQMQPPCEDGVYIKELTFCPSRSGITLQEMKRITCGSPNSEIYRYQEGLLKV